ncbi:hypothetical protein B0T10DRAFT_458407 [Thelonectria olida]|uniref:Nucleoside phosphorylase domain-containing protein n=1 Tax=Thelonectria olida TaxID=1576542 RepID=A0A9P8W6H5_9HYPO|nr:hypothetical protein B0T10DRAFT_458407 [Thelonectria olida]
MAASFDHIGSSTERTKQLTLVRRGWPPPRISNGFEIAIICALPLEYDAVSLLVDEFWDQDGDPYGRPPGDTNVYSTGRMGSFDVILVLLQGMGKVNAANAAKDLQRSFPAIQLALLTGICGGVPSPSPDVELVLGDVVISKTVVQYDFGRRYPDQFAVRDTVEHSLGRPSSNVRGLITLLETAHVRDQVKRKAADFLACIQRKATRERQEAYQYPGPNHDRLFQAQYRHKHQGETHCNECHKSHETVCEESRKMSCDTLGCDNGYIVQRHRLKEKRQLERQGQSIKAQAPSLFVGAIGSGDLVLKSGEDRDRIAKDHNVLAFEMEGAGIWDVLPCIVVKGICDYADSHKNKMWQNFAAATAASTTKALLERYPRTDNQLNHRRLNSSHVLTPPVSLPSRQLLSTRLTTSQAFHTIPFSRNEVVVDRDVFAKLEKAVPSTTKYSRVALWGLGGSGKTQIALEYAYRRNSDPTCSVFWVDADNEATFARDYKTIARKLRLSGELDGEQLLLAVRECIECEPQWLLVLDNADNLSLFGIPRAPNGSMGMFDYVPKTGSGTVLWTTRDERIVGSLVPPRGGIRVAEMREKEAQDLLETTRNEKVVDQDAEYAQKLLQELQWLPLAVSQAGAYMRRMSMPINEYLSMLVEGKGRWELLKETEVDEFRRPSVSNSVLETWNISIDRIRRESEMAYRVLNMIAYLDNQKMPIELLDAAARFGDGGGKWTKTQVNEAIIRLKEFSFISPHKTDESGKQFEMHTLVQEALRYRLRMQAFLQEETKTTKPKSRVRDRIRKFLGRPDSISEEVFFSSTALQIVSNHFPQSKRENWETCDKYLTQAVRVCDWVEIGGNEVVAFDLLKRVSDHLLYRRRWGEKEPVDKKLLHLRRKYLGQEHPDTMTALSHLATTYYGQGRYHESEKIEIKRLKLLRKVLGERHPDTFGSIANLAATYTELERLDDAEKLQVEVLEKRQEVLGERHGDTMLSMRDLARTRYQQGRYDEAEDLCTKAWERQRDIFGDKHQQTSFSMSLLALIYVSQNRLDKAEEMGARALQIDRETLGEKHPDTLVAMHNLANTWKRQGRSDAIALMQECWELCCDVLGPDHPDTKNARRLLLSAVGAINDQRLDATNSKLQTWSKPTRPCNVSTSESVMTCSWLTVGQTVLKPQNVIDILIDRPTALPSAAGVWVTINGFGWDSQTCLIGCQTFQ